MQKPVVTFKISSFSNRNIDINFGKIPFTCKKTKEFLLDLEGEVIRSFQIKPSNEEKCNVFFITPTEGFHKAGTNLVIKCTYRPNIPFLTSHKDFTFVGVDLKLTITLRGESIGPILRASTNDVVFLQEPRHKSGRSVIEIRNQTDIPAPFSMQIDSKQKLFTVTPLSGVCTSLTYVVVHFNPPDNFGAYAQNLNCLPYGCPPIVIHILGIYSKRPIDPETLSIIYYPFPFEEKNGYKGCFRPENKDVQDSELLAPVTLSTHYLEMGRAIAKEQYDDKTTISHKNFILTNQLTNSIVVRWTEDDTDFSIFPRKAPVGPGERMIFMCLFKPRYSETCYNRTFTAQIIWKPHNIDTLPTNDNVIVVPLTVSINVQGHSYREGQVSLGSLEILPAVVEFPLSLPEENIFQNFKITNKISRPVMFKLEPACVSNVVMTPMAGVIKDFVVILANIRKLKCHEPIDELWYVIINGQREQKFKFRVFATPQIPSIRIAEEDIVCFKSVQVNTIATKNVFLHNTCNFNVSFQIIQPENDLIKVQPCEGRVQMRKSIPITVSFKATECAPHLTKILCRMYARKKMNELVGPSFEHTFCIYTDTSYSELSATPLADVFYLVEYGRIINTFFLVYNFGVSTVYFKLQATCNERHIKIDPVMGQVEPNESLKVNVSMECKPLGEIFSSIQYYNRFDATSEEHTDESVSLIDISYKCEVAILKVSGIVEHTFGCLFSKSHFWNFLRIDEINKVLSNMLPGESEVLELNLPECPVGSRHYVTILIENISDLETEITLKKLKLCNCGYKQKPSKYRTEYVLDCVHRHTLFMEISQTKVEKKSSHKISIDVSYYLPGLNIMAYQVSIRPDRTLILYFRIYGIPENESRISVYNNEFFEHMYAGVLSATNPPAQLIWFYNNSSIAAHIDIDLSEINRFNEEYKYDIFECFYNNRTIRPKGIWPLMVRFRPLEEANFMFRINIGMNGEIKVLTIEGYGTRERHVNEFFDFDMPKVNTVTDKFPVRFSKDRMDVRCLPNWNFSEKIILIENLSNSRLIYYEWADLHIDNIIRITATENTGILRPGKSRAIKIRIESFNESILATFVLPCSVMDLQLLYAHKKMQALQEQMRERMEEEFEFSDYPINYSNNKNDIDAGQSTLLNKYLNYIMTVSVNVHVVDRRDLHIFMNSPDDIFKFNLPDFSNLNCSTCTDNTFIIEEDHQCPTDREHEPKCQNLDADIVENILEKILCDIVFDDSFPKIISTIFENYPLYYSQINISKSAECSNGLEQFELELMRKIEEHKFFLRPDGQVLAETFKSLIEDSINGAFNLTPLSDQRADESAIKTTMEHLNGLCTVKECECPSQKI